MCNVMSARTLDCGLTIYAKSPLVATVALVGVGLLSLVCSGCMGHNYEITSDPQGARIYFMEDSRAYGGLWTTPSSFSGSLHRSGSLRVKVAWPDGAESQWEDVPLLPMTQTARVHLGRQSVPVAVNPSMSTNPTTEAEYQAALAEYSAAVRELDNLRAANTAYNVLPGPAGIKLLGAAGTGAAAEAAQARVESARQRLEAARIKAYGR